jgi:glycosyltransferase involved in cell wall biosynthesis
MSQSFDPSFSVVINNHNNECYLQECIESVLSQGNGVEEVIVVDDGSTDNSENIIRKFAAANGKLKAIFQQQRGQISAISRGVQEAIGDVVLLLDGDDAYLPDHIDAMRRRWREFPLADLIFCRRKLIGDDQNVATLKNLWGGDDTKGLFGPVHDFENPYDYGYLSALCTFHGNLFCGNVTSTISIRNRHAKTLIDVSFNKANGSGDLFFLCSSALRGGRRVYVPDRTVAYRVHDNSLYSSTFLSSDNKRRYLNYLKNSMVRREVAQKYKVSDHDFYRLLQLESQLVPQPSERHRELYRLALEHCRRISQSRLERTRESFQRFVYPARMFLFRKGINTFPKRQKRNGVGS